MGLDKIILKHHSFLSECLNIGIDSNKIIDKINAFDWFDLSEAKTAEQYQIIINSIFSRFNFVYPKKYDTIIKEAFSHLFADAVIKIQQSITAVSKSYNIEGGSSGFRNEVIDKYYYIEYWANKKNIPVNYNEKNLDKRNLFNFDTIILSILSDKIKTFNEWEQNKPKK